MAQATFSSKELGRWTGPEHSQLRCGQQGKRGQQSEPLPTESSDELQPNAGSLLGLYRSATFQGLLDGLKSSAHAGQSLGIRACLLPPPRTDSSLGRSLPATLSEA